jgi:hypothetical protein
LQKFVTNEAGNPEWVHYCIVVDAAQALEVVREVEPSAAAQAEADLIGSEVIGSKAEPLADARRDPAAKALRGWPMTEEIAIQSSKVRGLGRVPLGSISSGENPAATPQRTPRLDGRPASQ